MAERTIQNAVITQTALGYHDGAGSIPTAWLTLDFGVTGQGFGGYVLGGAYTDSFVYGVLQALEVESWESLKGKHCRVEKDGDEWTGKIVRIGHILKEQWFDPTMPNGAADDPA